MENSNYQPTAHDKRDDELWEMLDSLRGKVDQRWLDEMEEALKASEGGRIQEAWSRLIMCVTELGFGMHNNGPIN